MLVPIDALCQFKETLKKILNYQIFIMNEFSTLSSEFVFFIHSVDHMTSPLFYYRITLVLMLSQPCISRSKSIWLLYIIVVEMEMWHPDLYSRISQLRLTLKGITSPCFLLTLLPVGDQQVLP